MGPSVGKRDQHAARCWALWLTLALSGLPALAGATSVDIGAGARVEIPLRSFKALRDHQVVRQAYDYSCGAAALATLLTYGIADPVTEQEVLHAVWTSLAQEQQVLLKKQGLSLLDLQRVAQARGHKAQGFRLAPAYLATLTHPVLVFITPRGYAHFAVLRGVRGDRVFLADPAQGNVRMSLRTFLDMWLGEQGKGIIFAVERHDGTWSDALALALPTVSGLSRPEILTVRQLLEVGHPQIRFPHLFR